MELQIFQGKDKKYLATRGFFFEKISFFSCHFLKNSDIKLWTQEEQIYFLIRFVSHTLFSKILISNFDPRRANTFFDKIFFTPFSQKHWHPSCDPWKNKQTFFWQDFFSHPVLKIFKSNFNPWKKPNIFLDKNSV